LHKDFDSLSFLEIQLLLEKEYGFEFEENADPRQFKMPLNATELAQTLILQHQRHLERINNSSAAKQ
jgi:hypothetical protein